MSAIAQTLAEPVARGHIYALGQHRIMCGDATCPIDVAKLCGEDKPTLVITSPPYADARDYNDPIADWDAMMMRAFCGHDWADNVQLLVNLGVIHRNEELVPYWQGWLSHMRREGHKFYAQYVWAKGSGLPGTFKGRLSPSHEFVFHLNKQSIKLNKWVPTTCGRTSAMRYNVRGKDGAPARSPLRYVQKHKAPDSVINLGPVRFGEACGHPAQMPKALASFLIRTWQKDGCIVYDPFGGTATTLLACELEGARGLAMEISPAYVQMALTRWQQQHPGLSPQRIA